MSPSTTIARSVPPVHCTRQVERPVPYSLVALVLLAITVWLAGARGTSGDDAAAPVRASQARRSATIQATLSQKGTGHGVHGKRVSAGKPATGRPTHGPVIAWPYQRLRDLG